VTAADKKAGDKTAADKRTTPKTPAITREALAAAGLAVLHREGLDALSMRKVAAELGVQAASLYYHVQDKEQLLDLLADSVVWDTRKLTGAGDWSDCLRESAHGYYRHLTAHRDTARLMAGRGTPGPNLLHLLDTMLGRMHAAGFSDADAAMATLLIATYVQGYVLQEQLPKSAPPAETPSAEASDEFANIAELLKVMAGDDKKRLFSFGVDRIIDGLRSQLPGAKADGSPPAADG
jgi:TetR/AcrR family transcriptional regulator, tetracycline repressor protein